MNDPTHFAPAKKSSLSPLLEVRDLSVEFETLRGPLKAIDRVSFDVAPGETLCLVGESGCGKSITSLALMGLLPSNGKIPSGEIIFDGKSLLGLPERERRKLRGADVAMIFQDPMSSLNPCYTVGEQILETIQAHEGGTRGSRRDRALELLRQVGIPAPEERLNAYPHQLSGGMSQRVMIAMAIACRPKLLIADEPTTALDVTIQAQILDLLRNLQKDRGMSLILITHDLGVVAEMADRVVVMYAGQIVETGNAREVIENPRHPYTRSLLNSLPASHYALEHRAKLPSIPGLVPDLTRRPPGCQLSPRCALVDEGCRVAEPALLDLGAGRKAKCTRPYPEALFP